MVRFRALIKQDIAIRSQLGWWWMRLHWRALPVALVISPRGVLGNRDRLAPKQDVIQKPASVVKGGNRVGIGHKLGKQKSRFLYIYNLPVDRIYWASP